MNRLAEWKRFRVALSRVSILQLTNTEWPVKPS
ncbi:tail fiber assembly protein [Pantoea alfalfae]